MWKTRSRRAAGQEEKKGCEKKHFAREQSLKLENAGWT